MLFLIISNANIWFAKKKLEWRRYFIAKVLPTTQRVKLIDKKEFVVVALDNNTKTFIVYIIVLSTPTIQVYPFC